MSRIPNSVAAKAKAFVSISIDGAGHDSPMKQIVGSCNRHGIPASLAMPDISAIAPTLASSAVSHEVALLADASLTKSELSRTELLELVVLPLQIAVRQGISISTLAVPVAWQPRHIDLLAKYGVTVIRTPHVFSSRTTTGIRAICYGLWQVPVSATLHGGGWMASRSQWRGLRRTIERIVVNGGWCHVRIDTASLSINDGLRNVDRLLGFLQELQAANLIAVETLRDMAVRLAPKRNAAAARSILRAA